MRKDDDGDDCPATLGEYRDLCRGLWGESSMSVQFLDRKILQQGKDALVIATHADMIDFLTSITQTTQSEGWIP